MPGHTRSRNLIFGKNSDREPNEAQAIACIPATEYREGDVRCTFIQVPQVRETYAVILSKPFQMWGAEMGVNEHGLVIGNEAVFTKIKFARKNDGLTGMDLLRLALERCRTAEQAMEMIVRLLSDYGQDACGGYQNHRFFYSNSFLIADVKEVWVLETAGRFWAAQKVESGFRSISNLLTIGEDYDLLGEGAIGFARQKGWLKQGENFSFKKAFSDWFYTKMARGHQRQCTTTSLGNACAGALDVAAAMNILSAHDPPGEDFSPSKCTTASVCMHATGVANPSNTTGSMIAEIRQDRPHTVWLTGTSMPCLSVWKPFFFPAGGETRADDSLKQPGALPDESLWWQAERVHRNILKHYQKGVELVINERQDLQQSLLKAEAELLTGNVANAGLDLFSKDALAQHFNLLNKWGADLGKQNLRQQSLNPFYRFFQQKTNRLLR